MEVSAVLYSQDCHVGEGLEVFGTSRWALDFWELPLCLLEMPCC